MDFPCKAISYTIFYVLLKFHIGKFNFNLSGNSKFSVISPIMISPKLHRTTKGLTQTGLKLSLKLQVNTMPL